MDEIKIPRLFKQLPSFWFYVVGHGRAGVSLADGGLGTNFSVCFKLRKKNHSNFTVCPHVLVFFLPVRDLLAGGNLTEKAAVDTNRMFRENKL